MQKTFYKELKERIRMVNFLSGFERFIYLIPQLKKFILVST